MGTSTVATIFGGLITNITGALVSNLPLVIGILAGLIGLAFLIRFAKRHIGGK